MSTDAHIVQNTVLSLVCRVENPLLESPLLERVWRLIDWRRTWFLWWILSDWILLKRGQHSLQTFLIYWGTLVGSRGESSRSPLHWKTWCHSFDWNLKFPPTWNIGTHCRLWCLSIVRRQTMPVCLRNKILSALLDSFVMSSYTKFHFTCFYITYGGMHKLSRGRNQRGW